MQPPLKLVLDGSLSGRREAIERIVSILKQPIFQDGFCTRLLDSLEAEYERRVFPLDD